MRSTTEFDSGKIMKILIIDLLDGVPLSSLGQKEST